MFRFLVLVAVLVCLVAPVFAGEFKKTEISKQDVGHVRLSDSGDYLAAGNGKGNVDLWHLKGKNMPMIELIDPASEYRLPYPATHFEFAGSVLFTYHQNGIGGGVYIWRKGMLAPETQKDDRYWGAAGAPVHAFHVASKDGKNGRFMVQTYNTPTFDQHNKEADAKKGKNEGDIGSHSFQRRYAMIVPFPKGQFDTLPHGHGATLEGENITASDLRSDGDLALTVGVTYFKLWKYSSNPRNRLSIWHHYTDGPNTVVKFSPDSKLFALDGVKQNHGGLLISRFDKERANKQTGNPGWDLNLATMVWDSEEKEKVVEIKNHHLTFSPDSNHVAVSRTIRYESSVDVANGQTVPRVSYEVDVWNVSSLTSQKVRLKAHIGEIVGLAFLDDDTVVTNSRDGSLALWNIHTGEYKDLLSSQKPAISLAVSRDGKRIASSHEGFGIVLFEREKSARRKEVPVVNTAGK